jgi:hypothetical protein
MTTELDKPLRREVRIGSEPWIVTLTPTGMKLTRKRKRKGIELEWKALVNGDAALAAALNASLPAPSRGRSRPSRKEPEVSPRPRRR